MNSANCSAGLTRSLRCLGRLLGSREVDVSNKPFRKNRCRIIEDNGAVNHLADISHFTLRSNNPKELDD